MIDEPFLIEMRITYDRYMRNISILEKKAQNIVIISGIMIALLMGANILDLNDIYEDSDDENKRSSYTIYLIFASMIILTLTIITCRIALKVHKQITPVNVPYFFKTNSDDELRINQDILEKIFIHNNKKMNASNYFQNIPDDVHKRTIDIQQNLIYAYLGSCQNAIKNSKRIGKWIRRSEVIFIIGLFFTISIPIITFI